MSADPEPIQKFLCRKRPATGSILLWIFLAVFVTRGIARLLTQPSTLNTVLLAICILFTACVLIVQFCKPDEPSTFYISGTHAGYGNPHRDPSAVPFASVIECLESPSSLNLTHESISVPLGIALRRHDFALEDWEILTSLLIQRVRQHAPRARIRTLLDPPEDP